MKKVILSTVAIAALAATANVNAATQSICGAGAAGNGQQVTGASDGTTFVLVAFTPKCSTNVHLVGDDNTTYYRAGAASTKGKNVFAGSTFGGGVASVGTCAATGCQLSDVTTNITSAASS